ncbi:hypothetical protein OC706_01480, partial ['Bituminaria bituminosa' little leaf phytoplasma]|uniref:hypothetical protein n=1 Tax=Candidatus Phytoplasma fabacearum TaxID=2982628 RepID=UPI0027142C97
MEILIKIEVSVDAPLLTLILLQLVINTNRLIAFYSAIRSCCFIYNQPPSKPDKQVSQHPAFHNSLSF